jgi:tetratricopeptide (TPR) repeat protein
MRPRLSPKGLGLLGVFVLVGSAFAQTTMIQGTVKDEKGQPLKDAVVRIERKDIKGNYKTKTNKKGEYIYAGLQSGDYDVILDIDGKERTRQTGVKINLSSPGVVDFDLAQLKAESEARMKAAQAGTITQEQARGLSAAQRAELEKQNKEQLAAMQKNKELMDAFNAGKQAQLAKDWDTAITSFVKAAELAPKEHVIFASLADSYYEQSKAKAGPERDAAIGKASEAWIKAIEINPNDAGYHNNDGLVLVAAKKIPEAEAEFNKAASLDPAKAAMFYYNLGATLTNLGQAEPGATAFKKALEADPNHADAIYQYGVYLVGKATTTPDGKIVPPPGTKEAFQKYLELKPDGVFAEGAKGMLAMFDTTVETQYVNPNAPKKGSTKKK